MVDYNIVKEFPLNNCFRLNAIHKSQDMGEM